MKKHTAIYVRVSTKQQSTRSQEPDLVRWAESQDSPIKWYRDNVTGTTMNRPGWNKLADAIEHGHVSTVVVWRIDRLGRTCKGLVSLFAELREQKINLVSLKDGLDLSTAAGRLMANVLASIAQFETELRAERVLVGMAEARAAGKRWGGSKPGMIKKNTPTAAQVKTIKMLRRDGESIVAIARTVGLSRPTVYKMLEG